MVIYGHCQEEPSLNSVFPSELHRLPFWVGRGFLCVLRNALQPFSELCSVPGICRTQRRFVTRGPFVSNSFHSGPLFTHRSGLIRVHGSGHALPGMFFGTRSSNCLNKTELFAANISVFFCLLLFLSSRPGEFAGNVPLPRGARTCKHYPAKGVTPTEPCSVAFKRLFSM